MLRVGKIENVKTNTNTSNMAAVVDGFVQESQIQAMSSSLDAKLSQVLSRLDSGK